MKVQPLKTLPEFDARKSVLITTFSLFAILLFFFVLLVSRSSFDEQKTAPALKSVQEAFSLKIFHTAELPSFKPDIMSMSREGKVKEPDMAGYFRSEIEGVEEETYPNEGYYSLIMPVSGFEKLLAGDAMAKKLAEIIKKPQAGAHGFDELTITVFKADGAANSVALYNRAADYASLLAAKGVDAARLSVGVEAGDEGTLRLQFRKFQNYKVKANE